METRSDRTAVDVSLLAIRLAVGIIFMAHGTQKLFGLFGGHGLGEFVKQMGVPLGYLVPIGEFFGGLGLIVGILTRFSAASLIVIMLGAIATVHAKNGFFLENKGFEYNVALLGLLFPILLAGPGSLYARPASSFPRPSGRRAAPGDRVGLRTGRRQALRDARRPPLNSDHALAGGGARESLGDSRIECEGTIDR